MKKTWIGYDGRCYAPCPECKRPSLIDTLAGTPMPCCGCSNERHPGLFVRQEELERRRIVAWVVENTGYDTAEVETWEGCGCRKALGIEEGTLMLTLNLTPWSKPAAKLADVECDPGEGYWRGGDGEHYHPCTNKDCGRAARLTLCTRCWGEGPTNLVAKAEETERLRLVALWDGGTSRIMNVTADGDWRGLNDDRPIAARVNTTPWDNSSTSHDEGNYTKEELREKLGELRRNARAKLEQREADWVREIVHGSPPAKTRSDEAPLKPHQLFGADASELRDRLAAMDRTPPAQPPCGHDSDNIVRGYCVTCGWRRSGMMVNEYKGLGPEGDR